MASGDQKRYLEVGNLDENSKVAKQALFIVGRYSRIADRMESGLVKKHPERSAKMILLKGGRAL